MKPSRISSSWCRPDRLRLMLLLLPLGIAACREAQVTAYRIPKEHDTPAPTASTAASTPEAGGRAPVPMGGDTGGLVVASTESGGLAWIAPTTWRAKPGSAMRKGSYLIGPEAGPNADLAITAFPGNVGGDLANVNRWLGQLSRPAITEKELATILQPLAGALVPMQVIDLAGGTADLPLRMLGAIVPHGNATWFFKLTGADALVAAEKETFLAFLKTVNVAPTAAPVAAAARAPAASVSESAQPAPLPAAAPDMASTPVVTASCAGLKWTAPAHWQAKETSAMRKATYAIPGDAGAAAELAVTAFPGGVGGDLANLNRWRGQLALPPITESEFADAVTRLTVNGLSVTVVDITSAASDQPQRLLGAMVPYAGSTWFFKLTGPAAVVAAEKSAFLAFVQTLSAP